MSHASASQARYVVVFRAQVAAFDTEYGEMATTLRQRALSEFGCLAFHALTEGDQEIALSYWPSLEAIRAWQQDPMHRRAQELGQSRWYSGYQVEVVEILRAYQHPN